MGDKLQRDDLDHCRQPLRRGHGKTGNVPTTKRFKEEMAHKLITCQKTYKEDSDTSPVLFGFVYSNSGKCESWCIAGSVAGGHTMHVPCISVAGLCARFTPTIKWHRIAK